MNTMYQRIGLAATVLGLTTAATIWVVAAIGMAVGGRFYVEAVGSTILVGAALVMLGRVESVIIRRSRSQRERHADQRRGRQQPALADQLEGVLDIESSPNPCLELWRASCHAAQCCAVTSLEGLAIGPGSALIDHLARPKRVVVAHGAKSQMCLCQKVVGVGQLAVGAPVGVDDGGEEIAAVGAAAAGLVNPLVAALLMPLSSGLVIWGAFRVERIVRADEAGLGGGLDQSEEAQLGVTDEELAEDLGLLTCDRDVGQDLTRLFNQLSGYAPKTAFRRIPAPRVVFWIGQFKGTSRPRKYGARAGLPPGQLREGGGAVVLPQRRPKNGLAAWTPRLHHLLRAPPLQPTAAPGRRLLAR